jgi:hypothetical protein
VPHQRLGGEIHDVVAQGAAEQELHRQIVDALGSGLLARPPCSDPPVSDEVTDEPAGRLELLARISLNRVNQVFAQHVAFGPVFVVAGQPQAIQATGQCRIH